LCNCATWAASRSKAKDDLRTRLSICQKKARYATEADATAAVAAATIELRHYACDRCGSFHLTSRTKGKRIARPAPATPV
jgi:hypothetical protein